MPIDDRGRTAASDVRERLAVLPVPPVTVPARRLRRRRTRRGAVAVAATGAVLTALIVPAVVHEHAKQGTTVKTPQPPLARPRPLPPRPDAGVVPLRPMALAVGPDRGLFVADASRHQILERLPTGGFAVVAGTGAAGFSGDGGPAAHAQINDPGGMAFGADGTLYFADQGNERVRAISPAGTITTVAGSGAPSTSNGFLPGTTAALTASITPNDVTVGPGGRLYISTGEQVLRLDPDHTLAPVVGADVTEQGVYGVGGPATRGSADGVNSMAFDAQRDLYLFGSNTKAVLMVTPSGTLTQPPGDQNIYPRGNGGLVQAPDGAVIAMNELSVVRLSPTGEQTIISFSPGTFHGIRGFSPNGIAVAPDGTIYVDTYDGNGFADRSAIASISADGRTSQVLWQSTDAPVGTLFGNGINTARFGDAQAKVMTTFDELFGQPTATQALTGPENCQIDASARWGEVTAFFSHGEFVGYRALGSSATYPPGGGISPAGVGRQAQTQLGLRVGDTLALAENLYGSALATSLAQGGTWSAATADGTLAGYLSGEANQHPPSQLFIESIGAGDVGCPAASP